MIFLYIMNNYFTDNINAEKVMDNIKNKQMEEKKILKKCIKSILNQCLYEIHINNQNNINDLFFTVPCVNSSPLYSPQNALLRIQKELRKNNFETYILDDYTIFITWDHIKKNIN